MFFKLVSTVTLLAYVSSVYANSYNLQTQIQAFNKAFGGSQVYFSSSQYLVPAQLSQKTVPVFKSVNDGNVKVVKNLLASHSKNDKLDVFCGSYKNLNLDKKYNPRSIYPSHDLVPIKLDNGPVPEFVYCAAKNAKGAGVAIITNNNPYAWSPIDVVADLEFCNNVCDETSFDRDEYYNVKNGYTFCCNLAEFKKKVPEVPFSASELL